jgi:ubiquinone/menaquinone biosynthesis C-methylase UbiE
VTPDRDVAAFDARAANYEQGWLGRFHREVVERTAAVALSARPRPTKILDVGCGTGYLLRVMASRCPGAVELAGIDPAAAMVNAARASLHDPRLVVAAGVAERLPYPDHTFDLVLSTTSFDHWADQRAGIAECARVMTADGCLVLADLFSAWLIPALVAGRRTKARTKNRATRLFAGAGLRVVSWHDVYPLIKAAVALREREGPRQLRRSAGWDRRGRA